jgi:hypothetical protein
MRIFHFSEDSNLKITDFFPSQKRKGIFFYEEDRFLKELLELVNGKQGVSYNTAEEAYEKKCEEDDEWASYGRVILQVDGWYYGDYMYHYDININENEILDLTSSLEPFKRGEERINEFVNEYLYDNFDMETFINDDGFEGMSYLYQNFDLECEVINKARELGYKGMRIEDHSAGNPYNSFVLLDLSLLKEEK